MKVCNYHDHTLSTLLYSLLLWIPNIYSQEIFSSIASLRQLVQTERTLVQGLWNYIENEQKRLETLRSFINENSQYNTDINDVYHPIKSYVLLKKWNTAATAIESTDNKNELTKFLKDSGAPDLTQRDGAGAAAALVRLQQVYDLSTDDLARGLIKGDGYQGEFGPALDSHDFLRLGQMCLQSGDYGHAVQWLSKAVPALYNDHNKQKEAVFDLARTHYFIGDYNAAARFADMAIALDPQNGTIVNHRNIYKTQNDSLHQTHGGVPYNTADKWKRFLPDWKQNYELLCRGDENTKPYPEVLQKQHCRYRKTFIPYAPVKEEVLSVDPWVAQLYEVISDKDIEAIKDMATPSLFRAQVGDPSKSLVTDERVSKVAWLWDNQDSTTVARLSKKISHITGLDTTYRSMLSSAEPFQVVNYGLGGQYEPHVDFYESVADRKRVPSYIYGTGDRIATYMLYLSDVTAGGSTVFTNLKIRVPAVKGSAAFWYNIKKNGEFDTRTQHAGCPVLIGEKWVANKWIREYGQEFRRPCGLTVDAVEDGY